VEAAAEYLTSWEDICKVASQEKVQAFDESFEIFKVAYRLIQGDEIHLIDYFVHHLDVHYSDLEVSDLEEQIKKLDDLLYEVILEFRETTGVYVGIELNYTAIRNDNYEDSVMFVLNWDDIVDLTPKAKRLKEMGVGFQFEAWAINY
jgi:hypothetical protein